MWKTMRNILLPVFYIIYINDLPHWLPSKACLFLYICTSDNEESTRTFKVIWTESKTGRTDGFMLSCRQMEFNIIEIKLIFTKKSHEKEECHDGRELYSMDQSKSNVEKDQSVYVDNLLAFKEHSPNNRKNNRSHKIIWLSDRSTFTLLYKSISVWVYTQWQPCQKTLARAVKDVQCKATKLLSSIKIKNILNDSPLFCYLLLNTYEHGLT